MQVSKIHAREILDSRGFPTLEAEITAGNITARAAVPSGASTGALEALELRDGDLARYNGKGVLKACAHINENIAKACVGQTFETQAALDTALLILDGTDNKSNLGANATLAVSLAFAHLNAQKKGKPLFQTLGYQGRAPILPVPMMNIMNGGAHADNTVDIQEFMVMPVGAPSFQEGLRYGAEIFHALKKHLKEKGYSTAVGDEGGFAPNLSSNEEALNLILKAIEQAGFGVGKEIVLALDVASTELYRDGQYHLEGEGRSFSSEAFAAFLSHWARQYPIASIEDGMAETDWAGWQCLTQSIGETVQLVGDDLFVTNTRLLQKGIDEKAANAILIKPNQIGTLTETLAAIEMAHQAGFEAILSHRSGETEDTTIADLAVGTGVGQIKTGSLCRTDRMAKYNQLLRLSEYFDASNSYPGTHIFSARKGHA